MTIRCYPYSVRWLYTANFEKIDFLEITESKADCLEKRNSITFSKQSHLIKLYAAENGFMALL
jgi:hypothetical protein